MAHSPSPRLSPTMTVLHRMERNQSTTPPPLPLSKRDKRRTQLSERLAEITAMFSANRDQHYREQLGAIQVDMNLIMHADPYSNVPLPDTGDEIAELVQGIAGGNSQFMMQAMNGGIASIAGKIYSDFAGEVNDAMEERDVAMTRHQVCQSLQFSYHDLTYVPAKLR